MTALDGREERISAVRSAAAGWKVPFPFHSFSVGVFLYLFLFLFAFKTNL